MKNRHKKILTLLLAAVMAVSITACGSGKDEGGEGFGSSLFGKKEAVTAESLLENLDTMDHESYNDITIDMLMSGQSDGQDVSVGMTAGLELKKPVMHMYDAKMIVGMTGFSLNMDMECWFDDGAGKTYMRMTALGEDTGWTVSDNSPDSDSSGSLGNLVSWDGLSENAVPVLQDRENDDADYTITWTMDGDKLQDIGGDLTEDFIDSGTDFESVDVTAVFDKDTKLPKSMTFHAVSGQYEFDMTVTFNVLNGDKALAVPDSVIADAVPEYDTPATGIELPNEEPAIGPGTSAEAVRGNSVLDNDGDGYDDVLDPLAEHIAGSDTGAVYVNLYHYEGMTQLSWYTDHDTWTGSVDLTRNTGSDWYDGENEFAQDVKFEREWSETEPEELDDDHAMFVSVDSSGWYDIEYFMLYNEYYIDFSVRTYDDTMTRSDALQCLAYLMNGVGITVE